MVSEILAEHTWWTDGVLSCCVPKFFLIEFSMSPRGCTSDKGRETTYCKNTMTETLVSCESHEIDLSIDAQRPVRLPRRLSRLGFLGHTDRHIGQDMHSCLCCIHEIYTRRILSLLYQHIDSWPCWLCRQPFPRTRSPQPKRKSQRLRQKAGAF